ncbi:MAG: SUMF1/EgtB/PvdO family nonheme iron enzyme [Planctomycetota bacterium]
MTGVLRRVNFTIALIALGICSGCASDLPNRITDEVRYPGKAPVTFDLVLVPGDADTGIEPFYMATHEVTWDMFYDWAFGTGLDQADYHEYQKQGLRPSPLYETSRQLKLGFGKRPALGMTRKTAEMFADWISERTGRRYRIPTDSQWQHALKLGGGVPDDQESLLRQGVFIDNAEIMSDPPFLERTEEVGSKEPNALGIYDMLGNAAEWVVADDEKRCWVRGGHFMLQAHSFHADWKPVEDISVWSEKYPQLPVTKYWYRDHYYQGIRLIADVQ